MAMLFPKLLHTSLWQHQQQQQQMHILSNATPNYFFSPSHSLPPFRFQNYHNHTVTPSSLIFLPVFYCNANNLLKMKFNFIFRRSRRLKTDDEIRSDIRQFLVEVGLPHGHIPSTKELLQHGRSFYLFVVYAK